MWLTVPCSSTSQHIIRLTLYPHSGSGTGAHMLCCRGGSCAIMSSGCFLTASCVCPVVTSLGPHCTPLDNSLHAHMTAYLLPCIRWLLCMHAYPPCRRSRSSNVACSTTSILLGSVSDHGRRLCGTWRQQPSSPRRSPVRKQHPAPQRQQRSWGSSCP